MDRILIAIGISIYVLLYRFRPAPPALPEHPGVGRFDAKPQGLGHQRPLSGLLSLAPLPHQGIVSPERANRPEGPPSYVSAASRPEVRRGKRNGQAEG